MDEMIICPCGKSDACFNSHVNNDITNSLCYGCGFVSNSLMKEDEEFFKQQYELLPEIYKDLIWEDNNKQKWMPSTVNIHDKGMIFPYGSNANDWKWAAVKAVEIPENERQKYPDPTHPGKFYTHKADMSTMELFDRYDYISALDYINVLTF